MAPGGGGVACAPRAFPYLPAWVWVFSKVRFQDIDETETCRSDKVVYMDQYVTLCDSSASGFHVLPRKLWLVCTGTTDNSSMAGKVVSKTGTEKTILCILIIF